MSSPRVNGSNRRRLPVSVCEHCGSTEFFELTGRQLQALIFITEGRTNADIGKELRIGEGTVKGLVSSLLTALGVENRTQAAMWAVRHAAAIELPSREHQNHHNGDAGEDVGRIVGI